MGQVVFVEEVSLVQVCTGRRPSPLSPLITHAYSVSTMGPGAATTSRSTTVTFVQCGLSTSETKCSGFNYLSILFSTLHSKVENPKKKFQNFTLGLCELRAFFMI